MAGLGLVIQLLAMMFLVLVLVDFLLFGFYFLVIGLQDLRRNTKRNPYGTPDGDTSAALVAVIIGTGVFTLSTTFLIKLWPRVVETFYTIFR